MPAPIVAMLLPWLAEKGLGLLKGAVEAKGKEVVEKIIGMALPEKEADLTPELALTLKQAEMAHEEKLTELSIRQQEIELQDRDSARKREVEVVTSQWAPMLNKIITPLLAIGVVTLTFLLYGALLFVVDGDLKPSQERVVIFIVGALTPICGQVISYYFGSSRGDAAKDQHLRELMKNGNGH